MGWIAGLKLAIAADSSNVLQFPRKIGVVSPWADESGLASALVAAEVLGLSAGPLSRADALRVPAISKSRAVLHSLIATHPLIALDRAGKLANQPTWLYRSDTGINPYLRNCQIIDDHLFAEASLLAVERGSTNQIIDAVVVPYDWWTLDSDGTIRVQGVPADPNSVVYLPGPGPGLLNQARATIVAALQIDQAWTGRVRNPAPVMILEEKEDSGMTSEEAKPYVEAVAAARRNPDSAVMFVPYKMNLRVETSEATDLFETGRNALRLDFANFTNLPASILDGSVAEASLTYSTQEGKRNELFDYSIPFWSAPIEQGLSLDNVVPRGQRIRFDFANLLTDIQSPTGPEEQD